MTVDAAWTQLRTRLVELVGVSGADILMDRPAGGWGDLVTNHTLDLRFAAFEERSDRKLDALEARMELRFAAVDAQFAEIRAGFAAVDHKFDLLRAEMRAQISDLRAEMDRRFRSQTLVMVSTFTALAGVMVAAIRL